MAWIRWIDEGDAAGRLKQIYSHLTTRRGIDHIFKIHSLNPESLEGHANYYEHLMRGPSQLSRAEREMIALVVSTGNESHPPSIDRRGSRSIFTHLLALHHKEC